MIGAQQVIDIALDAAARLGGADETIVLVGDRVATSLRWANNSMTTNGVSTARNTTVISIVRQGDTARVGTLTSAEVDPSAIEELVAASQAAAGVGARGTRRRAAAERQHRAGRLGRADSGDRTRGVLRPRRSAGSRIPGHRPAVRLRAARAGDDVSGDVERTAAPLHPTDRLGGDQRQTRRRQRLGGRRNAPTSPVCQRIRCSSSCRCDWVGPSAASSCRRGATRRSCRRRRWPT